MVGELSSGDNLFIQFFNILLRQCMEGLKLQLLGRNYFDEKASIKLPAHKLELWPGYVTSIRQHENNILLCCETSNKILRTETVMDQMKVRLPTINLLSF
jgi:aubergine-like protein